MSNEQKKQLLDAMLKFSLRVLAGGDGCTPQETAVLPAVLAALAEAKF